MNLLRNLKAMSNLPVYLSLDGHRNEADKSQQEKIISVAQDEHLVKGLIVGEKNLGCARGVLSSIDALFKLYDVDTAIILEDDCWPTSLFLETAQEIECCLESKFLSLNGQIAYLDCINGTGLSNYLMIHGWAVSKSKWNVLLDHLFNESRFRIVKGVSWKSKAFWRRTKEKVNAGEIDTWDAHMMWASWTVPEQNFFVNGAYVQNVGQQSSRADNSSKKTRNRDKIPSSIKTIQDREAWIESVFFDIGATKALIWNSYNFISRVRRSLHKSKTTLSSDLFRIISAPTENRFKIFKLSFKP